MPQAPARLQENGRVTIPVDVRKHLSIEKGDYVMVDVKPIDEAESYD
jgi:AbrB family looped-hinge helix DNA binding protein